MATKFKRLHAHVGHVWDIDKTDGSRVIVAEVDPHGFMGGIEARQEVATILASAPRLQEQNKRLRSALQGMLAMYDKLNWGASFLNAEDIRLMNEAPIAARAALGEE